MRNMKLTLSFLISATALGGCASSDLLNDYSRQKGIDTFGREYTLVHPSSTELKMQERARKAGVTNSKCKQYVGEATLTGIAANVLSIAVGKSTNDAATRRLLNSAGRNGMKSAKKALKPECP